MIGANGHQLPPGWLQVPLRDVLLPTTTTNPTTAKEGTFLYVDIEAVDNQRQRISAPRRIENALAPSRARNALLASDVIFSLVRPYLKNIAIIPADLDSAIASTAFFVCRPAQGIDNRFLLNFLRRDVFIASITTYGSSPPAARDVEFERLPVFVPPSAEQSRIANALDDLFSDLDAAVAALERVREKLKLYRASVLKAGVEGALTVEWREQHPNSEPASELHKRILAERRRRWEEDQLAKFKAKGQEPPKNWKAKYTEPVAPDISKLPPLPEGWCLCRGETLFGFITSGSRGWAKFCGDEGALFIRMGNLDHDSTALDLRETHRVRLPAGSEGLRTRVEAQDILISITADIGMVALIPGDIEEAYINQHIALARPVLPATGAFVAWYLESPSGQRRLKDLQRGATKVGLGLDDIRNVAIPFPSLAEQNAIVDAVEDQLSVIDHLEADLETKLKSAQALRQSILRHAFTGQLVPQDPNDEPATELLKRIAAEREAHAREAAAAKRTNKRTSGPGSGRRVQSKNNKAKDN